MNLNLFAVCTHGYNVYNGECAVKCPVKTYKEKDGVCSECHYTCFQCNGPNDYQCTSCWGDAELTHVMGQTYCYSKNIKSLLEDRTWYRIATVLLIINICLFLIFFKKGFCRKNNVEDKKGYSLANQIEGDD